MIHNTVFFWKVELRYHNLNYNCNGFVGFYTLCFMNYNHISDAPSSAPSLNIVTQVPVNEGQIITLQCSLSTLSYPAIVWSWLCGDYNLTKDASNNMTQSTLNLTANRTYNLRECQCWATSPRLSLKYNKSSEPKTIIVHCK